jgi:DNA-binding CsgD family transcriptional regulator
MTSPTVIGHGVELSALNEFLSAQRKLPAGLLFVGEAGIGKTTLWRHGLAAADGAGYQVMATQATTSESEMGFVVLAALLQEHSRDLMPKLPPSQRDVLEVALFLAEPGPEPLQPRAINEAFLSVLRLAAQRQPLLLCVDDVQWIDAASSAVLEFAIRRLNEEPIGFLFTRRSDTDDEPSTGIESGFPPDRLTRLRVGPLNASALHELLRGRLGVTFAPPTLRRLEDASRGNPFFALELARALVSNQPGFDTAEPLPMPKTLTAILTTRPLALPRATQEALLIASLGSNPSVDLIARTLDGDGWQRIRPAVESDIIQVDGERIRFVHPLMASVARASADLGRRCEAHRRLANVVLDTEERALHISLAAKRPSQAIASALEQASRRARSRGASDTGAVLAERAARLTPIGHPEDAGRRMLLAARNHVDTGALDRAEDLLVRLVETSPPGTVRTEALDRLASLHIQRHGPTATIRAAETALAEAADDPGISAAIEHTLAWAHHNGGNLRSACDHARRAIALSEQLGDSSQLGGALATLAFMKFVAGEGVDIELIERAVSLESKDKVTAASARWMQGMLLEWTGELHQAQSLLATVLADNVERGHDVQVPFVTIHLARLWLHAGEWAVARQLAGDALEQTLEMSLGDEQAYAMATAALIDAHRGRVESAREMARQGLALVELTGGVPARFEFLATLGFLELSLGDIVAAERVLASLAQAVTAAGFDEPAILRFDADYVEALLGLGRIDEAASEIKRLESHDRVVPNPWTRLAVMRCRGLLQAAQGDLTHALEDVEAASVSAGELGEPFELARTQLALANVQRRSKRWADARGSLEEALETFERLGAPLWAARVRAEIARIPGRARAKSNLLTATEGRVAELVAAGHSNKEVAAALFVTVKSVEANLSRVYAKLAVRSRSELAHQFAREQEPKL